MADHGLHGDTIGSRFVQCEKGCTFSTVDLEGRPKSGDRNDEVPVDCPYDRTQLTLL
jgi:hypothetical protein